MASSRASPRSVWSQTPAGSHVETRSRLARVPPKVVVAGRGSAGIFSAPLLASRGFTVRVVERHADALAAKSGCFALGYSLDQKGVRAMEYAGLSSPEDVVAPNEGIAAPKAVVVGSGPGGLFCAIALAKKGFQVEVVERHPDVSIVDSPMFSTTYTLDVRGVRSLISLGLEPPPELAVGCKNSVFHSQDPSAKPITAPYPPGVKILFLSRRGLVAWLIEKAKEMGPERIRFWTGWTFDGFENNGDRARFAEFKGAKDESGARGSHADSEQTPRYMHLEGYALFVGADGAKSKVRNGIVELESQGDSIRGLFHDRFSFTQNESKSRYKVLPPISAPLLHESLERSETEMHAFIDKSGKSTILCAPVPEGKYFPIIISRSTKKCDLYALNSAQEAEGFLRRDYPAVHKMYSTLGSHMFEEIAKVRVGVGGSSTYCSRLNHGKILLIGDAAHSVSPSLGQGCNAALEDTYVLNQLLSKYDSVHDIDIEATLNEFNAQRLNEVRTVVKLSEDPPLPSTAVTNLTRIRSFIRINVLNLAKKVLPSLQGPRPMALLVQDVPYSVIQKRIDEDERRAWLILSIVLFLVFLPFYVVSRILRP